MCCLLVNECGNVIVFGLLLDICVDIEGDIDLYVYV